MPFPFFKASPRRPIIRTRWMSRLDDGTLLSLKPHG